MLGGVLRAKVSTFVKLVGRTHELEESVVRAQAVLDNMVDGVVTATEAGVIESLNRAALLLLGYREDELIGQPLDLVIVPSLEDETMARRKDGSRFPIEVGVSRMELGERTFTISSFRDITGRKQRLERDRVAFEEAPFGSVMTSLTGRVERVNQAICTMTGLHRQRAGRHRVLRARAPGGPSHRRCGRRGACGWRPRSTPVREPLPAPRRERDRGDRRRLRDPR